MLQNTLNQQKQLSSRLIIAIDGPSASGKGTLAKMLANHFMIPYLNTGALYRGVALQIIEQNLNLDNFENYMFELVQNLTKFDLDNPNLFDEKTGALASIIAKSFKFRNLLLDFQKNFVKNSVDNYMGCVLDGRDTTTVICPDADIKFFITADVEIRATRRFNQQQEFSYQEILQQLKDRDFNDFNRQVAPLKITNDAKIIDNGNLTIEQGFQQALSYINSKIKF
jgi:cytidylate kinase